MKATGEGHNDIKGTPCHKQVKAVEFQPAFTPSWLSTWANNLGFIWAFILAFLCSFIPDIYLHLKLFAFFLTVKLYATQNVLGLGQVIYSVK